MAANFDGTRARTSPGALGLVAVNVVLIVQMLSFGIFPILVDGLVRLAHLDAQHAGLCVTAEMIGQAVGAAGVLVLQRWLGSRSICTIALLLILLGNALTTSATGNLAALLSMRAMAGIGSGLTGICIGLFATTKHPDRNFAIYNAAAVVTCAALAAGAPLIYASFGVTGTFAVIGGIAGLCLVLVPVVPPSATQEPAQGAMPTKSKITAASTVSTAIMMAGYFVSTSMFWSYAGQIGAWHHLDVVAVISAVASAWLVGGLLGSLAAIPIARRVSRTASTIACAAAGAVVTYASVVVGPTNFTAILYAFVFFWLLSYPIQMGIFAEIDGSGRLAMFAFLVQLIFFAIGPALGGLILKSESYRLFGLACALGYVVYIVGALMLRSATHRQAQKAVSLP
jgi:MFS family permease